MRQVRRFGTGKMGLAHGLTALVAWLVVATFVPLQFAVAAQSPEETPQAPAESPEADTPPASTVPDDYIIGPGDGLQVFVWRNPELSVSVPVRPDGKISTPLIEDMVAVGKTPTELARDMEVVLGEYIRSPQVNVIVAAPQNVFNRVTAIGQVDGPGVYGYTEGMRVMDLVLAAGGLTEFAAGNRARLVRTAADGTRTEIKVKLKDLLERGKLKENVAVQPGDVLIVPESFF